MKKACVILAIIMFFVIILSGCANNSAREGELLRIHVRANSDSPLDQEIKLKVKGEVISALSSRLEDAKNLSEAIATVDKSLERICEVANGVLKACGAQYTASVSLKKEYFPTRAYNGVVVESGVYDALIVSLGKAEGANWWCVIYPPLCFVNKSSYGSEFSYKSKIMELWRKYISPSG